MKPGYLTTEFLGSLVVCVAVVILCLAGKVDGQTAIITIGGVMSAYSVSRGVAKVNPPKTPTKKAKVD